MILSFSFSRSFMSCRHDSFSRFMGLASWAGFLIKHKRVLVIANYIFFFLFLFLSFFSSSLHHLAHSDANDERSVEMRTETRRLVGF